MIFKPPRPPKSSKMHERGVKNQKNHFPNLDSKMTLKNVRNELQIASQICSKRAQNATWIQFKNMMKSWTLKMSNSGSNMGSFVRVLGS